MNIKASFALKRQVDCGSISLRYFTEILFLFRKDIIIYNALKTLHLYIRQTGFILCSGELSKDAQMFKCLNSGLDLIN